MEVFHIHEVNNFWDGKKNAQLVSSGIYYWESTTQCVQGAQRLDKVYKD